MVAALREDKPFVGVFSGARNPEQLALWWVLCTDVADNCELFRHKDEVSEQLKLDLGHFDRQLNVRTGELREVTRSIAFESLPQADFDELFHRACDVIVAEYLPGMASKDLQEEVYRKIEGKDPRFAARRRRAA